METTGEDIQADQVDSLIAAAGIEGMGEILDAFWRSTDELLFAAKAQVEDGALADAAVTAHALKGSAANIGAIGFASLATSLETACRDEDHAGAAVLVGQMRAGVESLRGWFARRLTR